MILVYVKNLIMFLFVARLKMLGCSVTMINLPYNTPWVVYTQNGCAVRLYANEYVKSSTNNSGLTVFVEGARNNVMLLGDCRYRLVEGQTNDSISHSLGLNKTHYLVVPHHGGLAGKVSYQIANAKNVEGIVSVGTHNSNGHPNSNVMKQLGLFVRNVERTDVNGDIRKIL